MITSDYTIVANPSWSAIALQDVYLECDSTLNAINIQLPSISDLNGFYNVRFHIIDATFKAATNPINILAATLDNNFIDAATSVSITKNGQSTVVSVVNGTNWASNDSLPIPLARTAAALNQASFAGGAYETIAMGTIVCVVNYNATGKGVTVQRVNNANDSYKDWLIIATEDATSTGHIGSTLI